MNNKYGYNQSNRNKNDASKDWSRSDSYSHDEEQDRHYGPSDSTTDKSRGFSQSGNRGWMSGGQGMSDRSRSSSFGTHEGSDYMSSGAGYQKSSPWENSQDYSGRGTQFGNTSRFGSDSPSASRGSYGSSNSDQSSYRASTTGSMDSQYGSSISHAGKGPKGWKRSDERIREDVCEHLQRDHELNANHVEVTVDDGVVTLSGHVENRPLKRHAEELVEHISGVTDVNNDLKVDQSLFQQAKEALMGSEKTEKSSTQTTKPKH